MAPRLVTLDEIEAAVWIELSRATRDRAHAWRTPVLATVDGEGADARTVVLREIDTAARTLVFFADSRSPKLRQVEARPNATLVMWSASLNWQLRCRVRLSSADSGSDVAARWERIKQSPAAQDYLSPLAPGHVLDGKPQAASSDGHFAVVTATVHSIDWLELHAQGHRRAVLEAHRREWLQP